MQYRARKETPFGPAPEPVGLLLDYARVDFPETLPRPSWPRFFIATALAIVGSLLVDGLLVALGTKLFPSTQGYIHFRFSDYSRLTVIGVIFACVGWPIVTAISSHARWLFLRLAVLVTLVLFLPDLYLLVVGSTIEAVAVLMTMHLAIAVVTYNALVRLAPADRPGRPAPGGLRAGGPTRRVEIDFEP